MDITTIREQVKASGKIITRFHSLRGEKQKIFLIFLIIMIKY